MVNDNTINDILSRLRALEDKVGALTFTVSQEDTSSVNDEPTLVLNGQESSPLLNSSRLTEALVHYQATTDVPIYVWTDQYLEDDIITIRTVNQTDATQQVFYELVKGDITQQEDDSFAFVVSESIRQIIMMIPTNQTLIITYSFADDHLDWTYENNN